MTTRSGSSSRFNVSTCSSWSVTSLSSFRYAARVAKPRGGKREYLIGLQKGLFASVTAGKIILTFMGTLLCTKRKHTCSNWSQYHQNETPNASRYLSKRLSFYR